MKLLYLDCFSGVSGDMILGALLDLGLPLADLRHALGSLALEGVDVDVDRVTRGGVAAAKFRVVERAFGHAASGESGHDHAPHDHRTLAGVVRLIEGSGLSAPGRARAIALSEVASRQPKPSRITSATGRRAGRMGAGME